MVKILAIRNCRTEGFGLYERYLTDEGIELTIAHAYRGNRLPELQEFDAILIGGTPISANNIERHPFLQEEKKYLQRAIDTGIPCFGVCFGAQILALICGAEVRKCRRKEIGCYEVRLTTEGKTEPLLEGFPGSFMVFQWHGDTFDLPPNATLLVEGDDCRNQMYRVNNVIGIQFHLEITSGEVDAWADAYMDELTRFGKTKENILEEFHESEKDMEALAARLLNNFLSNLL